MTSVYIGLLIDSRFAGRDLYNTLGQRAIAA